MIRWGQSLFAITSHSLNVPNFPELGPTRSKREQSGLFVAATTGRVRVSVPRPLHGTSNNPPVVPGRGHFGGRGESQAGGHHGDSPISPRSENVAVPNMGLHDPCDNAIASCLWPEPPVRCVKLLWRSEATGAK